MSLKEKLDDLNNMILMGQILESMDKYYHPIVSLWKKTTWWQQAYKQPRTGKRKFSRASKRGLNRKSYLLPWVKTSR